MRVNFLFEDAATTAPVFVEWTKVSRHSWRFFSSCFQRI